MANLAFIQRVLYKLKQNYGFPLDLYKTLESSDNLETGRKSVRRARYTVKRAIILTAAELQRQFHNAMNFVAADKRFSVGGFYDTESLYVLIDRRDLPRGFEITLEDFAIHDHKRYQFDKAQLLEHKLAFWIEMREYKGGQPWEIHEETVVSILKLDQEISYAS
jgi:hypothetical protein